jgi:hypothetical protein
MTARLGRSSSSSAPWGAEDDEGPPRPASWRSRASSASSRPGRRFLARLRKSSRRDSESYKMVNQRRQEGHGGAARLTASRTWVA